jgi:hypothetical protein
MVEFNAEVVFRFEAASIEAAGAELHGRVWAFHASSVRSASDLRDSALLGNGEPLMIDLPC